MHVSDVKAICIFVLRRKVATFYLLNTRKLCKFHINGRNIGQSNNFFSEKISFRLKKNLNRP